MSIFDGILDPGQKVTLKKDDQKNAIGILEAQVKKTLLALFEGQTKEADFQKKKVSGTTPIYSAKLNDGARLVLGIYKFEVSGTHFSYLIILGVFSKHKDYETFLNSGQATKTFQEFIKQDDLLTRELAISNTSSAEGDLDNAEVESPIEFEPLSHYGDALVILTEDQSKVLEAQFPVLLQGPAGSGKTLLLFEQLQQAVATVESMAEINDAPRKPILFIGPEHLVLQMKLRWAALNPETTIAVEFKTQETLATEQMGEGLKIVDFETFRIWIDGRKSGKKKNQSIQNSSNLYLELKTIAVLGEQEYLDPKLGARHTRYSDGQKANAVRCFQLYQQYLNDANQFDVNLCKMTQPNQALYSSILVDESQVISPCLIHWLHRAAENERLMMAMDSNQVMKDAFASTRLLKLHFSEAQLTGTIRVPQGIAEVLQNVLILKNNLLGGVSEKGQSIKLEPATDRSGVLSWHDNLGDKTLSDYKKPDANTAFVLPNMDARDAFAAKTGLTLCFCPWDIVGQEYERIVVISPDLSFMKKVRDKNITTLSPATPNQTKDKDAVVRLEKELLAMNQFFVSCTRATKQVDIVRGEADKRSFVELKSLVDAQDPKASPAATVDDSSNEGWCDRVKQLILSGMSDAAEKTFNQHKSAFSGFTNFEAYRTALTAIPSNPQKQPVSNEVHYVKLCELIMRQYYEGKFTALKKLKNETEIEKILFKTGFLYKQKRYGTLYQAINELAPCMLIQVACLPGINLSELIRNNHFRSPSLDNLSIVLDALFDKTSGLSCEKNYPLDTIKSIAGVFMLFADNYEFVLTRHIDLQHLLSHKLKNGKSIFMVLCESEMGVECIDLLIKNLIKSGFVAINLIRKAFFERVSVSKSKKSKMLCCGLWYYAKCNSNLSSLIYDLFEHEQYKEICTNNGGAFSEEFSDSNESIAALLKSHSKSKVDPRLTSLLSLAAKDNMGKVNESEKITRFLTEKSNFRKNCHNFLSGKKMLVELFFERTFKHKGVVYKGIAQAIMTDKDLKRIFLEEVMKVLSLPIVTERFDSLYRVSFFKYLCKIFQTQAEEIEFFSLIFNQDSESKDNFLARCIDHNAIVIIRWLFVEIENIASEVNVNTGGKSEKNNYLRALMMRALDNQFLKKLYDGKTLIQKLIEKNDDSRALLVIFFPVFMRFKYLKIDDFYHSFFQELEVSLTDLRQYMIDMREKFQTGEKVYLLKLLHKNLMRFPEPNNKLMAYIRIFEDTRVIRRAPVEYAELLLPFFEDHNKFLSYSPFVVQIISYLQKSNCKLTRAVKDSLFRLRTDQRGVEACILERTRLCNDDNTKPQDMVIVKIWQLLPVEIKKDLKQVLTSRKGYQNLFSLLCQLLPNEFEGLNLDVTSNHSDEESNHYCVAVMKAFESGKSLEDGVKVAPELKNTIHQLFDRSKVTKFLFETFFDFNGMCYLGLIDAMRSMPGCITVFFELLYEKVAEYGQTSDGGEDPLELFKNIYHNVNTDEKEQLKLMVVSAPREDTKQPDIFSHFIYTADFKRLSTLIEVLTKNCDLDVNVFLALLSADNCFFLQKQCSISNIFLCVKDEGSGSKELLNKLFDKAFSCGKQVEPGVKEAFLQALHSPTSVGEKYSAIECLSSSQSSEMQAFLQKLIKLFPEIDADIKQSPVALPKTAALQTAQPPGEIKEGCGAQPDSKHSMFFNNEASPLDAEEGGPVASYAQVKISRGG